jgi:hypothetical protein
LGSEEYPDRRNFFKKKKGYGKLCELSFSSSSEYKEFCCNYMYSVFKLVWQIKAELLICMGFISL